MTIYEATEDGRQMTIGDTDIWRSANELGKQHGADAGIHAAIKADEFLAKRDLDGATVWRQIARVVRTSRRMSHRKTDSVTETTELLPSAVRLKSSQEQHS